MWELEKEVGLCHCLDFRPSQKGKNCGTRFLYRSPELLLSETSCLQSFQFSNCWGFLPLSNHKEKLLKGASNRLLKELLTTPRKLLHFECILPTFPVFSVVLSFLNLAHEAICMKIASREFLTEDLQYLALKKKKYTT